LNVALEGEELAEEAEAGFRNGEGALVLVGRSGLEPSYEVKDASQLVGVTLEQTLELGYRKDWLLPEVELLEFLESSQLVITVLIQITKKVVQCFRWRFSAN